jgi:L-2-hydroxyglutarate oxidase LhgO
MLTEFIRERSLPLNRSGKLVLATNEAEVQTIQELYRRGITNQVPVELISAAEAHSIESSISNETVAALWSPTTSTSNCVEVNRYHPNLCVHWVFDVFATERR